MTVRIAVLNGGSSLEREISLASGSRVTAALVERGHEVHRLDVDDQLVTRLADLDVAAAFLALHGSSGEDGTIQSLLALAGIPHTGPGALASSLAWDKAIATGLAARAGLAVPEHIVLSRAAFRDLGASAAMSAVIDRLGSHLVVKPAKGGSSLGLTILEGAAGLPGAIVGAFSYSDRVLVERFVPGTEVSVTVLDGETLPAVEVVPRDGEYDFTARYTAGATEFHAPARLGAATDAAAEAGAGMAEVLGARDICRVDMIVTRDGVPTVLEADTSPGLTTTSLVPMAATAAGIDFDELCDRLVSMAIAEAAVPEGIA